MSVKLKERNMRLVVGGNPVFYSEILNHESVKELIRLTDLAKDNDPDKVESLEEHLNKLIEDRCRKDGKLFNKGSYFIMTERYLLNKIYTDFVDDLISRAINRRMGGPLLTGLDLLPVSNDNSRLHAVTNWGNSTDSNQTEK
jgi:hypothetical protein